MVGTDLVEPVLRIRWVGEGVGGRKRGATWGRRRGKGWAGVGVGGRRGAGHRPGGACAADQVEVGGCVCVEG